MKNVNVDESEIPKIVDSTTIKSMGEFQQRYFPKDVGNKCAHCGAKLGKDKRSFDERNELIYPSINLP